MKLGKKAVKVDHRTLRLATYTSALEPAPAVCTLPDSLAAYDFGTMLNDTLGDCTCAAVGHAIQIWTFKALAKMLTIPDAVVLQLYETIGGYNPAQPSTDGGAVELDVLNYWRKNPVDTNNLEAYVAFSPASQQELQNAVYYFGGAYVGIQLPLSAQNQDTWSVPCVLGRNGGIGSWGGHAVFIVGYNKTGPLCITWGKLKQMTWAFYTKYTDEAYALLSTDWLNDNRLSPTGLDINALQQDLALIHQS